MRIIDMNTDPRKEHYAYFRGFPDPSVGLTVPCDITPLYGKKPFFLHILYCAIQAANSVPELRRRIIGDQVVEYESCFSSHTVALSDETYCYCELDCSMPFSEFLPYAQEQVRMVKEKPSIEEHDPVRLFFVSSVPWASYTALKLPVATPPLSNPQITFGKAYWDGERYLLPVSLTVHHGLCDGVHMAKFYEAFEEICSHFPE
ncbi:MAG: chloramphenicol acetyltransferase [Oscillospiraceae bacterium]|nr:chloramphenicol acetyltransferase [Oscillospiraceae bacterium]